MDEQGESRWLEASDQAGDVVTNSHGDPAGSGPGEPESEPGVPPSRLIPRELMQRVTETSSMVELLMRDLWTQAELEAESFREAARRQAEALIAEAQRAARGTLEQARERAEIIVGAARLEATKVAADAERLSREFLGKLSTLVSPPDVDAGNPLAPERPGRPD